MNKKLLKKLKKVAVGSIVTAIIIFLTLFLGNAQDPYVEVMRTTAEDL